MACATQKKPQLALLHIESPGLASGLAVVCG
jgi:hypothetical protein